MLKIRIIPLYNKTFEIFTFQLFTIDKDNEGITIIIINISFYYGV